MVEYEPAVTGLERRRSPLSWLLLPGIAFLLGLAAMAWLLSSWGSAAYFLGVAPEASPAETEPAPEQEPPAAQEPPPEPEPEFRPDEPSETAGVGGTQRLVIDPETQRRVAALEQRLGEITSQSSAAVGNAGRAEGLLVAFAARRALDRGIALGYIEHLLRQRFGAAQPQAVGTIIAVARQPITLQELQRELRELGPRLTGAGPNQGWWAALKTEIGGLVTIRRQGTQSTVPSDRLRRALQHVEAGEVNLALVEVLRMPDREQGRAWIDKARRYVAARSALDTIETAALLDPVSRPRPEPPARPQQRPQPARPRR
jgi:hypothetical protein